jgi:hypothetical protein
MEKVVNNNYRFERKIVVDSIKYEDLIYMFKSQGFNELFPERDICNVYLDDLNYHSLKDNILGNTKRLKHRIRWYGNLFGSIEKSVLEQKIKVGNVGFKNNFKISKKFTFLDSLSFSELTNLVRNILEDLKENIFIDFLYPASINTYTRCYFSDIFNRFRITIDKDIKYYSFQNEIKIAKSDPRVIIEIKYKNEDDIYVSNILNFIYLRLSKNSKYVNGIESIKL